MTKAKLKCCNFYFKKGICMKNKMTLRLLLLFIHLNTLTSFGSLITTKQEQLFHEIQAGNLNNVRELLKTGANVRDTNGGGSTPLHHAVLFHHLEIAKFLLSVGAHVNAYNTRDNNTPLHDAVDEGDKESVELLINQRANVTLTNRAGRTPCDEAEKQNKPEIANLLSHFASSKEQLFEAIRARDLATVKKNNCSTFKPSIRKQEWINATLSCSFL